MTARRATTTALTGIKPSAVPHLGNYLGAIRPALALAEHHDALFFIADYHALTAMRDPSQLRKFTLDVTATWLAAGLDPKRVILFRQSDIPEVCELMWILSCTLATGQLERGHAYKDAIERGDSPNAGVFNYPSLMAADILLYDADIVPVGRDQTQHLELTRDLAQRINHLFGADTLRVPKAHISESPIVPGIDGRKMSKSYGNSIPLFASEKELKSVVMKIKTGSEGLDDPKDPDANVVCALHAQVASAEENRLMREKLQQGGYGWGHAKQALAQALEAELGPKRATFEAIRADEPYLRGVLQEGASRARARAMPIIQRIRSAVGLR